MAWIVWPFRPMIRPTSLWRNWTRKMAVFPEGISESIISSGNSTSWRMTNSRNSFTVRVYAKFSVCHAAALDALRGTMVDRALRARC